MRVEQRDFRSGAAPDTQSRRRRGLQSMQSPSPSTRCPADRPLPGWTRTNNPSVNSRMLCQLSYRGLTTTRLRTIAAWSAYVVFRSQLLHGLINSGPYAIGLPAQPPRQRAVPGDRAASAKITTSGDGDAALSDQWDEPLNSNRCRNALPEELRQPPRLDELERAAGRWLAWRCVEHPAQLA